MANELLNEANKRAVVVAMQITSGKEIASTSEFLQYNSFSGGIFDDNLPIQLENNRFRITVNNLLPEVCGLIKNSIGINTTIRKVVCSTEQIGTGVFWFNSDLNPNDPQGDLCDVSNNIYCDYGQLCTTSGNIAGECINQQKNWECVTNEDCSDKPNTFCKISSSCDYTKNVCSIVQGSCQPLSEAIFFPNDDIKDENETIIFKKNSLLKSKNAMDWWSARSWCQAHGKSLIDWTRNPFQCSDTRTPSLYGKIYCCSNNNEACDSSFRRSSVLLQLQEHSPDIRGNLWGQNKDVTKAHSLYFNIQEGYFANYGKSNGSGFYALCK